MKMRWLQRGILVLYPALLAAQDLAEFEKKITEFDLANCFYFNTVTTEISTLASHVTLLI